MPLIRLGESTQKAFEEANERAALGGNCLVGLSTGFPNLDEALGGLRKDSVYIIGGRPGMGKLLSLEERVATPTGYISLRDVQIGDTIFDENGLLCNVTFISDVEQEPESYRITFDDGETVDACADHQWFTITRADTKREFGRIRRKRQTPNPDTRYQRNLSHLKKPTGSVKTTKQIKETLYTGSDKRLNHFMPVAKPLQLPEVVLPIPPYTFGAWLGDGTAVSSNFTSVDLEIIQKIRENGYEIRGPAREKSWTIVGLVTQIRALGVWNNKHIPIQYLRASYEQRLELLRGLMDTDGHITRRGTCEITQKKKQLAYNIKELVHTLGMKATIEERQQRSQNGTEGTYYRVRFSPNVQVFHLPRKAEQWQPVRRKTTERRYIVSVEPIDPIPMRCISVNSPSNLFLVGEALVPTHNTSLAISMGYNVADQYSVLVASLEMQASLLSYRILSGITGIPALDIEYGRFPVGGIEKVRTAVEACQNKKLWIMDDTSNTQQLEDTCRIFREEHGLDLLVVDYISLLTDQIRESEAARVGQLSRNIRTLARTFDIPVICVVQLNRNVESREGNMPVLSDIGWSGNIEQDTVGAMLLYRPHYYELLYNGAEPKAVEDDAIILLQKNRHGPIGQMKANFIPNQMRWEPQSIVPQDIPRRG